MVIIVQYVFEPKATRILDSRIKILDSRIPILDSRIQILDSRLQILDSKMQILDSGYNKSKCLKGIYQENVFKINMLSVV